METVISSIYAFNDPGQVSGQDGERWTNIPLDRTEEDLEDGGHNGVSLCVVIKNYNVKGIA